MHTVTSTTLLAGLHDHRDDRLWSAFCARYQPLLLTFGRRLGLGENDAQDAAQDTLMAFARDYRAGRYDRNKGRLRTWLFGIASKKIRDTQRRRMRSQELRKAGGDALEDVPDDNTMSELWEAEWQRAVVRQCLEEARREVEPRTFRAFERVALQGRKAADVAAELGMSRNAVYQAKSHVLERMQRLQKEMEDVW